MTKADNNFEKISDTDKFENILHHCLQDYIDNNRNDYNEVFILYEFVGEVLNKIKRGYVYENNQKK